MPICEQPIVATQHRMENPILKRIPYRGTQPAYDGIVDYVIVQGNHCIFSGITRDCTSTINAAEQIVDAIYQREEFEPEEIEFFDLQTCRGYDFRLEQYEFSQLNLTLDRGGRVQRVGWSGTDCPSEVLEFFKGHIGTYTMPLVSWDEAVIKGYGSEENVFSSHDSPENAEQFLRHHGNLPPKPTDTHVWVVVDLATKAGHVIENGRRYETRVKFTEPEEVHESRWEMKSMTETRKRIVEYKSHALTSQELKELAEIFHRELARWNGKPHSDLRHSLEMFMRVYVCILEGNDTPDHLLECFIPGARGIIGNLCATMPDFRTYALGKGGDNSNTFEAAIAHIASETPYTGEKPVLSSTLIN